MQKILADKNPLTSKIFRKKIRNMKFFIGDSLKIPDFAGILSSILSTDYICLRKVMTNKITWRSPLSARVTLICFVLFVRQICVILYNIYSVKNSGLYNGFRFLVTYVLQLEVRALN